MHRASEHLSQLQVQHIAAQCNACRGDVGTAADNACSKLAAAGSCVSTVLQSVTLILRALCQHEAAAVVSYIPQACAESGSIPYCCSPVQSCPIALLLLMLLVSANAMMAVEII